MRRITPILAALALGLGLLTAPASADDDDDGHGPCSLRALAGKWVFHTTLGKIIPFEGAPATDIAAVGTLNISRDGEFSGVFDATFFNVPELTGPDGQSVIQDVPFGGPITIESDCTGTLDLLIGGEFVRTDSLVVVSPKEIRAISLGTEELFSYEVLRISGSRDEDR